jgi:hypothetical protein
MKFKSLLPALLIFILFGILSCSDDGGTIDPPTASFEYGETKTYSVDENTDIIEDELTGLTLWLPFGGEGEVIITEVLSGPSNTYPGKGFSVEYTGNSELMLVVEYSEDDEEYPQLFHWEKPIGIIDDDLGNGERWASIPPDADFGDGQIYYFLDMGSYEQEVGSKNDIIYTTTTKKNYWLGKIPGAKDISDIRLYSRLQIQDYRDLFYDELSPTLKSKAKTKAAIKEFSLIIANENYYKGFWWKTLFTSRLRQFHPTIKVTKDVKSLAHETGHYLTHLIVSDDVQDALESQSPFFSSHGLTDIVGRNMILEEYAYFIEFFLNNSVGGSSVDLEDPYGIFISKKRTPANTDMAGVEGFGAVMIQLLLNDKTEMRALPDGILMPVPKINIGYDRVFDIISLGATDKNTLRSNIFTKLSADEQIKYQILLHRAGWQYKAKGKLVDKDGKAVANAEVKSIIRVGGVDYVAWKDAIITTNSSGEFLAVHGFFPGKHILQITTSSGKVIEKEITTDWNSLTTDMSDLGTITVDDDQNELVKLLQTMTGCGCYFYTPNGENYLIAEYTENGLLNGQELSGSRTANLSETIPTIYLKEGDLTWSGLNFSGTSSDKDTYSEQKWVVSGKVSKDGKILESATLTYTYNYKKEIKDQHGNWDKQERSKVWTVTLSNIDHNQNTYYLTEDLDKVKAGVTNVSYEYNSKIYKEILKGTEVHSDYTGRTVLKSFDISGITQGKLVGRFGK